MSWSLGLKSWEALKELQLKNELYGRGCFPSKGEDLSFSCPSLMGRMSPASLGQADCGSLSHTERQGLQPLNVQLHHVTPVKKPIGWKYTELCFLKKKLTFPLAFGKVPTECFSAPWSPLVFASDLLEVLTLQNQSRAFYKDAVLGQHH